MLNRSRDVRGVWIFLVAFTLEASAQPPSPKAPPKADQSPKAARPGEGWEEWVGSVSSAKFEFDRLRAAAEGDVMSVLERDAVRAKHAKNPVFLRLLIKREQDGSFAGTLSYPDGLRPFELKVSGRVDEKGNAAFTEEIDPRNVPQWHPWPWRFSGTVDEARWKGSVGDTRFLKFLDRRP